MRKNENKNEKGRGVVQLLIKRKSIKRMMEKERKTDHSVRSAFD